MATALNGPMVQQFTVARLAEYLAASWDTANDPVRPKGTLLLIADSVRFDGGRRSIGVDEHVWRLTPFDRPRSSNGPSEAVNGRLEQLPATAVAFRNMTHHIACSILNQGRFTPRPRTKIGEPLFDALGGQPAWNWKAIIACGRSWDLANWHWNGTVMPPVPCHEPLAHHDVAAMADGDRESGKALLVAATEAGKRVCVSENIQRGYAIDPVLQSKRVVVILDAQTLIRSTLCHG